MDTEAMVRRLLDTFAAVPDPRSAQGRRHPLGAILTLATAAMLAGARTLYDIWQWGRIQEPAVVRALGFTREKTPAVSTLHRVFRALDVDAFEAPLRAAGAANAGQVKGGGLGVSREWGTMLGCAHTVGSQILRRHLLGRHEPVVSLRGDG
ncbi:MAG: transposase family protein [Chloroflexi bacterium]|nr:transposase family protein [Chloroflexota bacterium]